MLFLDASCFCGFIRPMLIISPTIYTEGIPEGSLSCSLLSISSFFPHFKALETHKIFYSLKNLLFLISLRMPVKAITVFWRPCT